MDSMAPVTVVTNELVVLAEVLVEVLDVVVFEVRVPVLKESAEELLTPGEQPTKLGADSLTDMQVAMLNAIAPTCRQRLFKLERLPHLLCWSDGAQEVDRQQDSALT
jgi:hypothetical protein